MYEFSVYARTSGFKECPWFRTPIKGYWDPQEDPHNSSNLKLGPLEDPSHDPFHFSKKVGSGIEHSWIKLINQY